MTDLQQVHVVHAVFGGDEFIVGVFADDTQAAEHAAHIENTYAETTTSIKKINPRTSRTPIDGQSSDGAISGFDAVWQAAQ